MASEIIFTRPLRPSSDPFVKVHQTCWKECSACQFH